MSVLLLVSDGPFKFQGGGGGGMFFFFFLNILIPNVAEIFFLVLVKENKII